MNVSTIVSQLALALSVVFVGVACDSKQPDVTCEPGQGNADGTCMESEACESGQENADGTCEPEPSETCESGQENADGTCESEPPEGCEPGQENADGTCESEPPEVCESGQENSDGTCDPEPPVVCEIEDPEAGETCSTEGATRECCDGLVQYCGSEYSANSELQWSLCTAPDEVACVPGETALCCEGDEESCGELTGWEKACILVEGDVTWDDDARLGLDGSCWTPLVLVFDKAPVRYNATSASAAAFDIDTTGSCLTPAWPTADTPWLALDRDKNGTIDAGNELFGSGTRLASGSRAPNGFAALAELDSDGDGRITAADPGFADLVLWSDHNADRRSSNWELTSLVTTGIVSIDLDYDATNPRCDSDGNCEIERAAFEFRGRDGAVSHGEVVDIHVTCD